MDFVSARTADGRWFRRLTVIDVYTRESLALVADRSLTGIKVVKLVRDILQRGATRYAVLPGRANSEPQHSPG